MNEEVKRVLKKPFFNGLKDGIPIGLGYLAVSFSIGLTARNVGMSVFQGFLMSFFNNASAGEVAGVSAMSDGVTYITAALIILVTNARYILMSCAMSQKFSPDTPLIHRFLIGFDLTDELFGIAVAYPGYIKPSYMYGAMSFALPMWSIGGMCGIAVGNILPDVIITAMSVAVYGMFLQKQQADSNRRYLKLYNQRTCEDHSCNFKGFGQPQNNRAYNRYLYRCGTFVPRR